MQPKKVLITEQIHPILYQLLTEHGFECTHWENTTYAQVLENIHFYNGLIVRSLIQVDAQLINAAPKLEFIGRAGAGMELIDTEYATQKNIPCFNSPEGNRQAVAEYTLGALISLLHRIAPAYHDLKQLKWNRKQHIGSEINAQTIGIIGYGNTGSSFAKLLQPFGAKVLAYDKYKDLKNEPLVTQSSLQQIMNECTIISFHIPLNAETAYFCDHFFLKQCSLKPIIINTSRGGILQTQHLIQALQNENISGAILDVFENEQFSTLTPIQTQQFKLLAQMPNVIITPHIAGITQQSQYKIAEVLAKKIIHQYIT